MSRKIKIQTVDKTKSTELENTLKENFSKSKHENTTETVSDNVEPCIENTGDASAYTNENNNSTVVNIHDIKIKNLIERFNDIILDITTDDFTDDMSMDDRIIKIIRRNKDCNVVSEDFQLFLDIVNNENFEKINCLPEDIKDLIVKLHGIDLTLNYLKQSFFKEIAGYYNFLINKLLIPIELITKDSYYVKLANHYINGWKSEFDVHDEDLNKLSETAGNNYKTINEKIKKINNRSNDYAKCREYINSEDTFRHLDEHYNSVDTLIARDKANKDSIRFNNLTGEKINPINDVTEEFKRAKVIGEAFKTFRDENGVTKYGKLEDVEKILENISENNDNTSNIDNQVGELPLSNPEENMDTLTKSEPENNPCNMVENSTTYEEVNHPDHYNVYDVEVVDMMERIFGIEETMSWCKLNAFKYRMRAGEKPTSTVEKDLKKEKWCLNKYKELKSKK